ncbi:ATP-binding protein [Nonomuraea angiospora]|uniref:ATP-binding protein n=1 Tax=Nonomuraea angiospora TaxID=46172 RepID=UPI0033207312
MSAYRIVQEAVTNVTRYAEHPSCQVTIDFGDEELAIEIIDPAPSLPPDRSLALSLDPGSGSSPDPSRGVAAAPALDLNPAVDPTSSFGPSSDASLSRGSEPGFGAVTAHSSGSGAGRGFGFGGGRGPGRGRKAGVGYGLVGMRERVALLHGVFSAGPRQEGGFRVVARLPAPARVR